MSFKTIFPPIDTALEMEPEELAPFVLQYLATQGSNINRYNFTLGSTPEVRDYAAGGHLPALCHRLMEAWMWLEREGFVMPRPGDQHDWATITRRGHQVLAAQDFTTYRRESVLRSNELDPILVRKVKPAYLRGDYDTAIFQAFKEVEVRVRKKGGFPDGMIGGGPHAESPQAEDWAACQQGRGGRRATGHDGPLCWRDWHVQKSIESPGRRLSPGGRGGHHRHCQPTLEDR